MCSIQRILTLRQNFPGGNQIFFSLGIFKLQILQILIANIHNLRANIRYAALQTQHICPAHVTLLQKRQVHVQLLLHESEHRLER